MTPAGSILRHWSAWLPMLLSVVALLLVVGYSIAFGAGRSDDEGGAARIFQVVVLSNAFAIGYFGARWLPVAKVPAAAVLALQILLAALPLVLVSALEGSIRP